MFSYLLENTFKNSDLLKFDFCALRVFQGLGAYSAGTSVGPTSSVREPSRSYCSLQEIKRHDFGAAYFVSLKVYLVSLMKRKTNLKGIQKTKINYLKEATLEMRTGHKH